MIDETNICDSTYDIDNRDFEEEMIQQDIEEEAIQEEEQEEQEEQQQAELNYTKSRSVLNAKNLALDLEHQNERERVVYTWRKKNYPDVLYSGHVVHKFDNDAYIFEVNSPDGKKLKKFRLSEIKQQWLS